MGIWHNGYASVTEGCSTAFLASLVEIEEVDCRSRSKGHRMTPMCIIYIRITKQEWLQNYTMRLRNNGFLSPSLYSFVPKHRFHFGQRISISISISIRTTATRFHGCTRPLGRSFRGTYLHWARDSPAWGPRTENATFPRHRCSRQSVTHIHTPSPCHHSRLSTWLLDRKCERFELSTVWTKTGIIFGQKSFSCIINFGG